MGGEACQPTYGIGFVAFDKSSGAALSGSAKVPLCTICKWLPRKNQIVMVELLALMATIRALAGRLAGRRALFFIDSEPVEGAVVKGYSPLSDMGSLLGYLWTEVVGLEIEAYFDGVSKEEMKAILDDADRDHDGRLTLAEFKAMMDESVRTFERFDPRLEGRYVDKPPAVDLRRMHLPRVALDPAVVEDPRHRRRVIS